MLSRLFCRIIGWPMIDLSHEFIRFCCVNKIFTTHTECMKPKKEGIANDDSSVNENKNGGRGESSARRS